MSATAAIRTRGHQVMKHYLLLAHDQPDHVRRLVRRLDDGEATFWLHVDARVEIADWVDVVALDHVVLVSPRVACTWGTWSLVEATLAMVRACIAGGIPGHVLMLSGQSYPLRSAQQINTYLSDHSELIHMDLWALPERWPDNYRDRLDYFCIPMSDIKGNIRLLRPRSQMNARELVGWTRRLVREIGPRRAFGVLKVIGRPRPDLAGKIVGGSQWWAMPWSVLVDLMEFHDQHPEFEEFLRWSQFADESFFQTLLVNMDDGLRARLAPSTTYVDWTEGEWDLPRVMGKEDVPVLLAQPDHVLFARKFLAPVSDSAAAALDNAVLDDEQKRVKR